LETIRHPFMLKGVVAMSATTKLSPTASSLFLVDGLVDGSEEASSRDGSDGVNIPSCDIVVDKPDNIVVL
jgi:hypothetical protein